MGLNVVTDRAMLFREPAPDHQEHNPQMAVELRY